MASVRFRHRFLLALLFVSPSAGRALTGRTRALDGVRTLEPDVPVIRIQKRQSTPNDGSVPNANYPGCYLDYSLGGPTTTPAGLTWKLCVDTCSDGGYTYAGLFNGNTCKCGNTAPPADSGGNCGALCNGNTLQYCGSLDSVTLFSIEDPAEVPQGDTTPPRTTQLFHGQQNSTTDDVFPQGQHLTPSTTLHTSNNPHHENRMDSNDDALTTTWMTLHDMNDLAPDHRFFTPDTRNLYVHLLGRPYTTWRDFATRNTMFDTSQQDSSLPDAYSFIPS
ncbi:hypothetical protein P154DRAFT_592519 [Amniculicola lignicola CBS 123094]|uniref:WSC domain-containing protein n=1 Tax=Amniculicola lignicola CBS 123094 TaxID=1392246 RepID=A0A6A5WZU3_9PLEO|nr:hypothetical protein P154DRAFT_592519 [Amniculicola lignicola CBS 123094]